MQLLRMEQTPIDDANRRYRNRSWVGLLGVAVIFLAITLYVAIPKGTGSDNTALAAVPALVTLLFVALLVARLRVYRRPSSWLVLETDDGLYVNLRSYLNNPAPDDAPRVIHIPRDEIAAVGKTHEFRPIAFVRGTRRDQFSYIDVYLKHEETAAVADVLRAERRAEWPGKRHDYPVRVPEPGVIRLVWDWIAPNENRALDLLSETYPLAEDRTLKSPRWEHLSDEDKKQHIIALWELGEVDDARRIVRMEYQLSKRAAEEWLDEHCADA